MRLATVMMSLRLAGALTFAPEPIVIATSFSVRVWQIWRSEVYCELIGLVGTTDRDSGWHLIYLQDGDAVRDQSSVPEKSEEF